MKFFVIHGQYLVPFSELGSLGELVDEHRAFVQRGYDRGDFLFSGPQIPAEEGILVARAASLEAIVDLMEQEPFVREGKVRIARVTEFRPAVFQDSLASWVAG